MAAQYALGARANAGLIPRGLLTVWESIRDLAAEDVTVCFTTQYLEEADRLADRISLLDDGGIVAEGDRIRAEGGLVPGVTSAESTISSSWPPAAAVEGGLRREEELTLELPGDGGVGLSEGFSISWSGRPSRSTP